MAPEIDTGTNYNLLINTLKTIRVPYILTIDHLDLVVQLDGITEFHFDFQGNYLTYKVPLN